MWQPFKQRTWDSLSDREQVTAFQAENTGQPFRQRTWDSLSDIEYATAFQIIQKLPSPSSSPSFPVFPSLLLPYTSLFLSGIFHCRKFRQGTVFKKDVTRWGEFTCDLTQRTVSRKDVVRWGEFTCDLTQRTVFGNDVARWGEFTCNLTQQGSF